MPLWSISELVLARTRSFVGEPTIGTAIVPRRRICDIMSGVVGHQAIETWLGAEVLTLADLIPERPRVVCVGVNPAPASVDVGHYYQGALGRRFFARLRDAELTGPSEEGFDDDAAFLRGIGFTDLAKRPTPRAADLSQAELLAGVRLLEDKLVAARPQLVVFTFKKAGEVLFGRLLGSGFLPWTVAGVRTFVMPSPYASKADSAAKIAELRAWARSTPTDTDDSGTRTSSC